MPKHPPLIPTEIVLREFDTLSGSLRLIPEQVSMIMGISTDQLAVNRSYGRPPPHVRQGGKILYRLEDVRNYLKAQPVFHDDLEALLSKQNENNRFG